MTAVGEREIRTQRRVIKHFRLSWTEGIRRGFHGRPFGDQCVALYLVFLQPER